MKLTCTECNGKGKGKIKFDGSPCDCCICGGKGYRTFPKPKVNNCTNWKCRKNDTKKRR